MVISLLERNSQLKTNSIKWYGVAALLVCVAATATAEEVKPEFPDPAMATLKGGIFPIQGNLRNVVAGLNKDQMQSLLGPPHFDEGFFRVRTWDYIFKFHENDNVISCQYQVHFDDARLVDATYWKDEQCANFVSLK
jgi:outer membrane protein assembly factor BamE (lipoprotein component of BamABCDE complex)